MKRAKVVFMENDYGDVEAHWTPRNGKAKKEGTPIIIDRLKNGYIDVNGVCKSFYSDYSYQMGGEGYKDFCSSLDDWIEENPDFKTGKTYYIEY